ncbi:MAG: hypothetical protein ACXVJ7_06635 [Acidimicrobiia bacterium]
MRPQCPNRPNPDGTPLQSAPERADTTDVRKGLLAMLAATAGLLLVAAPAAAAPPDTLIVPVGPAGFVVAADGRGINGPVDLDTVRRLSSVPIPPSTDVTFDGAARTWVAADNQAVIVIAARTDGDDAAAEMARGAVSSARAMDQPTPFDSGLPGIVGISGRKGVAYAHAVVWSEGPYAVIAIHASAGPTDEHVVSDLARREATFLTSRYGVAVNPASDDAPSSFPALGVVAGFVVLAALVGTTLVIHATRSRPRAPEFVPIEAPIPAPGTAFGPVGTPAPPARPPSRPGPAPIPWSRAERADPPAPETAAVATPGAPAPASPSWDDRFPD